MLHAVLLPTGPLERTIDLQLDQWTEPGWPEHLQLSVLHDGETVHHEGGEYEIRPVNPPTLWALKVVLPGGLGVYQRQHGDASDGFPVTWTEHLPAASTPRPFTTGPQRVSLEHDDPQRFNPRAAFGRVTTGR